MIQSFTNICSGFLVIQKFIILILPAFGIYFTNCFLFMQTNPFLDMKVCVFAMATIGVLGFLVWAHHSVYCWYGRWYTRVASQPQLLIIAVPTGIKIFSCLRHFGVVLLSLHTPMLFALGFIMLFNFRWPYLVIVLANSCCRYYVYMILIMFVAHFHYVFINGCYVCFYLGDFTTDRKNPSLRYNEVLAKAHFYLTFIELM